MRKASTLFCGQDRILALPSNAVMARDGVEVFLAPGGILIGFDHNSVNETIAVHSGEET